MSTIRQVSSSKSNFSRQAMVAMNERIYFENQERKSTNKGPEDRCWLFRHRHRNKECFRQHSQLRPKKNKPAKKDNGKMGLEEQD